MDLLIVCLFMFSFEVSGSSLGVNSDLQNDVGLEEVQGYGLHEKFSDRKDEGRPHFVTPIVHRYSPSSQEGEGSLGRAGEQKISEADNVSAYKTSGGAESSGTYVSGKEITKIVMDKTNSHATPYNSVLSDSIKHSIGEDATHTHKPIIVRELTLSEADNDSRSGRTFTAERNDGAQLSSGALNIKEERLSVNSSSSATITRNNDEPNRSRYKVIVRQPYYSSYSSQRENGFAESSGSSAEEEESVLHTTVSSKELTPSVIRDESSVANVRRGIQGGYSTNEEHQEDFQPKSLKTSVLPTGTQNYLDHSITGDRVNVFSLQPRYIPDQNIFGRYPSSTSQDFLNHNGFTHPFLSTQFGLATYNSRSPIAIHHQPTLHHVEHTIRSPSEKGSNPVQVNDEVAFGRGFSYNNLYFPSYPDNGEFSFGEIPFMRSPPSFLSYSRDAPGLGLPEGFTFD